MRLGGEARRRNRRAVDERGLGPDRIEAGAGGPRRIVHLPAGPAPVSGVGRADRRDRLGADREAEIAEMVERRHRPEGASFFPPQRLRLAAQSLGRRGGAGRHYRLRVPAQVGRRAGQAVRGIGIEGFEQPLEPAGRGPRSGLEEDVDVGRTGEQPIEGGGRAAGRRHAADRDVSEGGQRRLHRRFLAGPWIGQDHQLEGHESCLVQGPQGAGEIARDEVQAEAHPTSGRGRRGRHAGYQIFWSGLGDRRSCMNCMTSPWKRKPGTRMSAKTALS